MEKVYKDGNVAVLISAGYGAGWYTWNYEYPAMLFDPWIVDMVLAEAELEDIVAYATVKWPDAYLGGADGLRVEWIPVGTEFKVNEYDGSESVEYKERNAWLVA